MKSIKEKAKEYRRVIEVIDEHESIVDTRGSEIFEAGANYVLGEIERIVKYYKDPHCIEFLKEVIQRLKEK